MDGSAPRGRDASNRPGPAHPVLVGSLFWLGYFDLKDRPRPESRHELLLAFLLGVVAAGLSVGVFWGVQPLGVPDWDVGHRTWIAVYCFAVIGPVEEGAKVLMTCVAMFLHGL